MGDNSSTDFEEGAVADRVRELCGRGLERFREGDVEGALVDWNRARALDPEAHLPRAYIERAAHGLDPESGEIPSGIDLPLGAPPDSGEAPAVRPQQTTYELGDELDDDDDYLELELTAGEPGEYRTEDTVDVARRRFVEAALDLFQLDEVDAGWSIEPEEGNPLPPPPSRARAPSADLGEVAAAIMGVPDEALVAENELEPDLDDLPVPEPARLGGETLDMPADSDEYREVATRELTRPAELGPPPIHESDSEITVPGGATGEVVPSGRLTLSDDALEALGGGAGDGGGAAQEDTTVERPGVVKRGLALPDLDELFGDTRRDDRHDTEGDHRVSFREGTEDGLDQELTTERPSFRAPSQELTVERGAIGALDDELTTERPSYARPGAIELPALDDLFDVPETAGGSPAVIVEPGLLEGGGDDDEPGLIHDRAGPGAPEPMTLQIESGAWETVCETMRDQVAGTLPAPASDDDRVRNWVSAFIDRARLEADRNNPELAVTALELALGEQPDSVVAQKLIHRHRDLLVEIYQSYLGDGRRVPMLAVPMHELQAETLDSRAVFLLSRIDGTFSVEDILDVSGMSEIEAYRHLSKLALKGILELR